MTVLGTNYGISSQNACGYQSESKYVCTGNLGPKCLNSDLPWMLSTKTNDCGLMNVCLFNRVAHKNQDQNMFECII